jgi:hypothetical protein
MTMTTTDQPRTTRPRSRPKRPAQPAALVEPGEVPPARGIVSRQYGRTGHGYKLDGVKVPGVTAISGMIKGPGLISYTGKQVAAYAVNYWDTLAALPPADRLEALNESAWAERDAAAGRGTEVHRLGAALSIGATVTVPDELEGHVEQYRRWLDEWGVDVMATELVVANRTVRYCGRADVLANLPRLRLYGSGRIIPAARWLVDVKTSKPTGRIWPETAVQTCGYRHAEVYLDPDTGEEHPMDWLAIERAGCLRIWHDGHEFVELDTGEETWAYFRQLAAAWWASRDQEEWVGATAEPLEPPAAPPVP